MLQDLIERTAKEIYDAQMQNRVVLGNPFSASIRDKCRAAVPEALTLLTVSEVLQYLWVPIKCFAGFCRDVIHSHVTFT